MEKYSRIEKPKQVSPINQNEIRITTQGLIPNYLSYASTLLLERHAKEIVLKGMGQAISKSVALAEIIKKRIPRLHQDVAISSVRITDLWEPKEEGLVQMETTRQVSMITITLSTKELNKDSPGYQAPPKHEQQPRQQNFYHHNQQPRQQNFYHHNQQPQRQNFYYHNQQQSQPRQERGMYNAVYGDSYGGGRGRGRGRGSGRPQSWGHGGYGTYQDNGGYQNWGRGGGQGRGWGYYDYGGYQGSRGGGGGGRGYGRGPRGRGLMGGRSRGGAY